MEVTRQEVVSTNQNDTFRGLLFYLPSQAVVTHSLGLVRAQDLRSLSFLRKD